MIDIQVFLDSGSVTHITRLTNVVSQFTIHLSPETSSDRKQQRRLRTGHWSTVETKKSSVNALAIFPKARVSCNNISDVNCSRLSSIILSDWERERDRRSTAVLESPFVPKLLFLYSVFARMTLSGGCALSKEAKNVFTVGHGPDGQQSPVLWRVKRVKNSKASHTASTLRNITNEWCSRTSQPVPTTRGTSENKMALQVWSACVTH